MAATSFKIHVSIDAAGAPADVRICAGVDCYTCRMERFRRNTVRLEAALGELGFWPDSPCPSQSTVQRRVEELAGDPTRGKKALKAYKTIRAIMRWPATTDRG